MSARSVAAARAEGKRRAAILRAIDLDGPICECGVLIAVHPPLPKPRPWELGRPCGKSALDRGRGWDGREAPKHTAGNVARWSPSKGPAHRSAHAWGVGA